MTFGSHENWRSNIELKIALAIGNSDTQGKPLNFTPQSSHIQ